MPIDPKAFVAAVVLQRAKTQLDACGCEGADTIRLLAALIHLADKYSINPPALLHAVEGIEANIRDGKLELAEKKLEVLRRNTGENSITAGLQAKIDRADVAMCSATTED